MTKTKNNTYGYVRVSSAEQKEDRQLISLAELGVPSKNIFIDKVSGKNFKRPAYKKLIRRLKTGDLLVIDSIDRLGRNYEEIISQWRLITREKGIDVKVIDMPLLDTTYHRDLLGTFISDLVLQVMSFMAQRERENTLRRQAEGISAAKKRGVHFGREKTLFPNNFDSIYMCWRSGEFTASEAAVMCGVSRQTLYDRTKELRERENITIK